jgi:type IV pilus assembly protein PilE
VSSATTARPVAAPQHGGFTLVELMIAVVVVAILAAIAIPGYRGYVLRAGRAEATAALLRTQAAQEKFFVQYGRYAAALAPAPPAGLGIPASTEGGRYGLSLLIVEGGAGFRVTATVRPGAPQADDARCASLTIDHNGLRGARDSAGEDNARECWR